MIDIAPILPQTTPPPQATASSPADGGSESTFDTIFKETTSSKTPQDSDSSQDGARQDLTSGQVTPEDEHSTQPLEYRVENQSWSGDAEEIEAQVLSTIPQPASGMPEEPVLVIAQGSTPAADEPAKRNPNSDPTSGNQIKTPIQSSVAPEHPASPQISSTLSGTDTHATGLKLVDKAAENDAKRQLPIKAHNPVKPDLANGLTDGAASAQKSVVDAPNQHTARQPVILQKAVSESRTAEEPIISSQLQRLIDSNETGVLRLSRIPATTQFPQELNLAPQAVNSQAKTIKRYFSHFSAASTAEAQAPTPTSAVPNVSSSTTLTPTTMAVIQEPVAVTDTGSAKPVHLRQDIQGQYLEAKLEANTGGKDSGSTSSGGSGQQDPSGNAQQAVVQTTPLSSSDQSGSFSQASQSLMQQVQQSASIEGGQPASLLPGATVQDEHVLRQVAENFRLQTRQQETQLNIKLHPVELGELKIDLTFKEGAIRAHVFAQSQQVQEILEKNMPRLKEMLEGHGFKIEEMLVSAASDTVGDFDLLQQQFSHQEPATDNKKHNPAAGSISETFDDIINQPDNPETGVNIKV